MSRIAGAVAARLRLALALVLGTALALLVPALLGAQVSAPSAVVLASLAVAVAAVVGVRSHLGTTPSRPRTPRSHPLDQAAAFLAARVADPTHHPLRPRAPGLA